jgi:moderate conductance mechanosensitive channel
MNYELFANYIRQHLSEIIWIIVLFFFGKGFLKAVISKMKKMVDDGDDTNLSAREQRAATLGSVIKATGNAVIYVVIILMLLNVFEIDIRPVLAGAGIVGLAIGFGAQTLVKDFVSGLFILVEDQYAVGDKVKIGLFEGKVKKITMRSTVLEDADKNIIYISNGSITNVSKKSRK